MWGIKSTQLFFTVSLLFCVQASCSDAFLRGKVQSMWNQTQQWYSSLTAALHNRVKTFTNKVDTSRLARWFSLRQQPQSQASPLPEQKRIAAQPLVVPQPSTQTPQQDNRLQRSDQRMVRLSVLSEQQQALVREIEEYIKPSNANHMEIMRLEDFLNRADRLHQEQNNIEKDIPVTFMATQQYVELNRSLNTNFKKLYELSNIVKDIIGRTQTQYGASVDQQLKLLDEKLMKLRDSVWEYKDDKKLDCKSFLQGIDSYLKQADELEKEKKALVSRLSQDKAQHASVSSSLKLVQGLLDTFNLFKQDIQKLRHLYEAVTDKKIRGDFIACDFGLKSCDEVRRKIEGIKNEIALFEKENSGINRFSVSRYLGELRMILRMITPEAREASKEQASFTFSFADIRNDSMTDLLTQKCIVSAWDDAMFDREFATMVPKVMAAEVREACKDIDTVGILNAMSVLADVSAFSDLVAAYRYDKSERFTTEFAVLDNIRAMLTKHIKARYFKMRLLMKILSERVLFDTETAAMHETLNKFLRIQCTIQGTKDKQQFTVVSVLNCGD